MIKDTRPSASTPKTNYSLSKKQCQSKDMAPLTFFSQKIIYLNRGQGAFLLSHFHLPKWPLKQPTFQFSFL